MPLFALAIALIAQTSPADTAFQAGNFNEAKALYARERKGFHTTSQLGYIAMLSNRFADAERLLGSALKMKPGDANAKLMLAETYYRQDKFLKAAPLLKNLSKYGDKIRQTTYASLSYKKLASFKGLTPYEFHGKGQSTSIKLITLEPLPLLHVKVNGKPLTFFIDTGGAEVTLDYGVAKRLKVPILGTEIGTFSGGKTMKAYHGRINSLNVGDWELRNLPIQSLDLQPIAKALGRPIDGIVGTMLFYHFLTTLDYPNSRLIFTRRTPATGTLAPPGERAGRGEPGDVKLPIWLAGDHFAVTPGSLNGRPPVQMFVDTGYIGGMFKAAPSVIKSAGITLDTAKASEGQGAGGGYTTTPFTLDSIKVGPVQVNNSTGTFEGVFPWEHTYGFLLAGMIGDDFFKPYAVTFDYRGMRLVLTKRG